MIGTPFPLKTPNTSPSVTRMNKQQRLKQWIAALALAGFLAPVSAPAQDAVTLSAEAIAARESGDLLKEKAKLEEVLKLSPDNDEAKARLAEVNKALLSKADAPKPTTPLDIAAEKNLNLFREVEEAKLDAQNAAARGDYEGAVALLDEAAAALPSNTAGQSLRDSLTQVKQSILADRDSGAVGVKGVTSATVAENLRINKQRVAEARELIEEADSFTAAGRFEDAGANLSKATATLPNNSTADTARIELKKAKTKLITARYSAAVDKRDMKSAEKCVDEFETLNGKTDKRSVAMRADFTAKQFDPHYKSITEVSPDFAAREKRANELLAKGRAQYLYGDYIGALETYKEVLQYQPFNTEAKSFSIRIRETLHEKSGSYNPTVTKTKLLESVDNSWAMPESFQKDVRSTERSEVEDPVVARMKKIIIPQIDLPGRKLSEIIPVLAEYSIAFDKDQKGVNFNLIDPEKKDPEVSLSLRGMPLSGVLEQVLRSVNYSYTVNNGVVEIRPDTGNAEIETEFFPLSQGAVTRMTGAGAKAADSASPFGAATGGGEGERPEIPALKRYFRGIGIEFSEANNTGLNFDGQQLIVTHNRRVLERVRNTLRRYSDTKQIAIESKFIEVNQGTLNEIATNWSTWNRDGGRDKLTGATGNRTLESAFKTSSGGRPGLITRTPNTIVTTNADGTINTTEGAAIPDVEIPNNSPSIPGQVNYGGTNSIGGTSYNGTFSSTFGIGGYDVNVLITALEQTTGSDLMAAPSVTVKDSQQATIKIVQLLRYPTSYSAIQSQVSSSGGNWGGTNNNGGGGGGASVAITAGTPQDFEIQEVGISLGVTPTVQADGESIELDLEPKITEFEGFVEYGGTSVAVINTTTVTVPSGFYQPIFSVREVKTKVTVYDGATVVLGGLTREEVKTVHDKVPVLGDIPVIGKLFRSDGKTSNKKNLMIFVTANMISPTGSQLKGAVGNVRAGTTFQNPTLASPSGPQYRAPIEGK